MKGFQRILVAVDFSEHSNQALDMAVGLAKEFGAKIDLIHAFDVPVPFVTPYEVAIPDTFMQEARDAAKTKLAALVEKVGGQGLEAQSHLTEVPAATAITRVAEEIGADLIVMGTRGNTGLKHVLLGSVAERTLRHAPCSVLTVK
jgi:universal stress protein A